MQYKPRTGGSERASRLVSTVSQQCLSTRFLLSIVLIFPGQGLRSSCDGLATVGSEHRWITWTNTTAGTPYFPAGVGDLLLDYGPAIRCLDPLTIRSPRALQGDALERQHASPLGPVIEIPSTLEFPHCPSIWEQLGRDLRQGAYPITSKLHGYSAPQSRADSWIS